MADAPAIHPIRYFWRHPRRSGFIVFNVLMIIALLAWAQFTAEYANVGLAGIPNVMLGYTGMAIVLLAWVIGWLAWAVMVYRRHHRTAA